MVMKKFKSILGRTACHIMILSCAAFIASCEGYGFSEDCEKQNRLEFLTDWSLYKSGAEKPAEFTLYFYQKNLLEFAKTVHADASNIAFLKGDYKILACNNAPGIILKNMDDYQMASASLFTTVIDGVQWMEQPSMFVLDNDSKVENMKEGDGLTIAPRNVLSEFSFSLNIKNYTSLEIRYVTGSMSGLGTKIMLASVTVVQEEHATQAFNAVASEEAPDVYKTQIYCMGFTPRMVGQKSIKKILTLEIEYFDGTCGNVSLDLSDKFDEVVSMNKVKGNFDVVITDQNVGLNLVQWSGGNE